MHLRMTVELKKYGLNKIMGRLFIENVNEYDLKKNIYCKTCKDLKIEISSIDNISTIQCETVLGECYTFHEINYTNIIFNYSYKNCEIHPNTTDTFCILDLEPFAPRGIIKEISCKGCLDVLGWDIIYHMTFKYMIGLKFILKHKVI